MTMILSNLYIGSLDESFDCLFLEKHNITHVLNTASKHGVPDDCHDSNIQSILDLSIAFITDAHNRHASVIVHCLEGKKPLGVCCGGIHGVCATLES